MTSPTIDWNWFFSSLAQSAAAIVGIFGAFIITKILSNQGIFSDKNIKIKELIADGEKISDQALGRYFEWYNTNFNKNSIYQAENLLIKDPNIKAEEILKEINFSPFTKYEEALEEINDLISKKNEQLDLNDKRIKSHLAAERARLDREGKTHYAAAMLNSPLARLTSFPNLDIGPQLIEEREFIDKVFRDARHHSRVVSNFHQTISNNPESSTAISYSLIMVGILFLLGVIYPLSFLPAPVPSTPELSIAGSFEFITSIRGILLSLVSIIFGIILIMFFTMNFRMKYSQKNIEELLKFSLPKNYSTYLDILEENIIIKKEKTKTHN